LKVDREITEFQRDKPKTQVIKVNECQEVVEKEREIEREEKFFEEFFKRTDLDVAEVKSLGWSKILLTKIFKLGIGQCCQTVKYRQQDFLRNFSKSLN
jgi:hypothetical protein